MKGLKIAVLMKDVPDLVEDLEINDEGTALDFDSLSFIPSEWDDNALEEALLLKDETGSEVVVIAVDTGDIDNMLYTALAKGADRAVKIVGDFDHGITSRARAHLIANYLKNESFDLIVSGVQAVDDLDGQVPALVAGLVEIPHASVISDVNISGDKVRFRQEYSGGVMAEFEAAAPLVLGIQASKQPPRYASIAKVRQTMKSAQLNEVEAELPEFPALNVTRLYKPEASGHAEMIDGDVDEVAEKIISILADRNLLRG